MDEFQSVQATPQVQFNQKTFFESFWGKLTIFLALVILLVITITALNYFNIVPLSQKFPFLNFLPTKQIQTIKQDNTIAQTSSIQNPTISGFTYDASKAQIQLTQYLKDTIKEEFLPTYIPITAVGEQEGLGYTFGASWNKSNVSIQSNFYYDLRTNNPSEIKFFINLKDISTINASTTQSLVDTYLKNVSPDIKFECGTFKDASYCESFSSNKESKQGFGLLAPTTDKNHSGKIFSCYIPLKSSIYAKTTSCLAFRQK